MRRALYWLALVFVGLVAARLQAVAQMSSPVWIITAFRNATHFDGNVWIDTPLVWNAPNEGNYFFINWWQNFSAPPPDGEAEIFGADSANTDYAPTAVIREYDNGDGETCGINAWFLPTDVGLQSAISFFLPFGVSIPCADKVWREIQISVNTDYQSQAVGEYMMYDFNDNYETGNLYLDPFACPNQPCSGPIEWWQVTDWNISRDEEHIKGDIAEYYVDLNNYWPIGDATSAKFLDRTRRSYYTVPRNGAIGLDTLTNPYLLNCAAPSGTHPTMCNRGGPSQFRNGIEVAGSVRGAVWGYTMQEHGGKLQPSKTGDPCSRKGWGAGCLSSRP